MKQRIGKVDLERIVLKLNKLTKSPTEFMTDGVINIGHYTLDWAYGGVQLQRVTSTGGSVTTIIHGFTPKRELYENIQTYMSGIKSTQPD